MCSTVTHTALTMSMLFSHSRFRARVSCARPPVPISVIKTSSSTDMPKLVSRGALLRFAILARPPSASAPPDNNLLHQPLGVMTSHHTLTLPSNLFMNSHQATHPRLSRR